MRRQEKECTDQDQLKAFLQDSSVMHIAINTVETPYILPVNHIYYEDALYFHSANVGRKLDLIRANPLLGFSVTEMIGIRQSAERPCGTGTAFRSVTGTAKAVFIENEKNQILNQLITRFTKHPETSFPDDILNAVAVIRLEIISISFKVDTRI